MRIDIAPGAIFFDDQHRHPSTQGGGMGSDDAGRHARRVPTVDGHCVWEERAAEYASLSADWVADRYREATARGPTAAVMSPATDGGNDELEQ
jgi:hypothetical protein